MTKGAKIGIVVGVAVLYGAIAFIFIKKAKAKSGSGANYQPTTEPITTTTPRTIQAMTDKSTITGAAVQAATARKLDGGSFF